MGAPMEVVCQRKRQESLRCYLIQIIVHAVLSFGCIAIGVATIFFSAKVSRPLFAPLIPGTFGLIGVMLGIRFYTIAESSAETEELSPKAKKWFMVYYGVCFGGFLLNFNMLNPLIQLWLNCDEAVCDLYDTELLIVSIFGIIFTVLIGISSSAGWYMYFYYSKAYGVRGTCCRACSCCIFEYEKEAEEMRM